MRCLWRYAAIAVAGIHLGGCVSVRPVSQQVATSNAERVDDRNYRIGVEQSTVVGEPIVRLKRYTVRRIVTSMFTVSESCRVHLPMRYDHTFAPGDAVTVIGDSPCDEGTCRMIRLDSSPLQGDLGALIMPDGRLSSRPINLLLRNKQIGHIDVQPESCRFVPSTSGSQSATPGPDYRNFEILYGGIDGQTLRFTYREYSFDDLARPAFTQAFSYPADSTEVRFKDVVVRIAEAKPDTVRYTVTADGS